MGLAAENEASREIGEYERYLKRKTAVENFLYDTMSQTWNHGDDVIACRLRDLGVRQELENCYGLIGVAHYDQITKVCSEVGRPKPARLRDDGPSIVFPFYDLPGRLTGFLLLQYNSAYESKQTYIPLSGIRTQRPEAGYFMLQSAWLSKQPALKNTQFIFEDVLWVVKSQCQAFSRGQGWLPIMASYTGPEAESYGTSWQSISPATRIFHGHSPTPELISRACNAKGYVSIIQTSRVSVLPKLAAIRTGAQTWQNTLNNTLLAANEQNAESFAKRLTIPPEKLHKFLTRVEKAFSSGFKDRVLMAVNAPNDNVIKGQRWFVFERDNGWWSQSGLHVSNFRPVITHVVHADDGEKTYRGFVAMDGTTYPFSDSARKIERVGLLEYATGIVAPHGKLGLYDNPWNKKAHLLAMQLHAPKLITVSTKYGWDDAANVFRFARYAIDHNGTVVPTPDRPNIQANKDFSEPLPIAPLPIHDIIQPAHENSFIWAVAASVLTNLVAPILRKDNIATALPPDTFWLGGKIAAAMGCDVEKTTAFQKHVAGNFLEAKTADTKWPILCYGAFNDEVFGPSIHRYFNRPLLLRVTKEIMAVSIGYGWQSIMHAPVRHAVDVTPLAAIVPAYIQKTLQDRMATIGVAGNLTDGVLEDLHEWLMATYGTAFNLPHTKSLMRYPCHAHTALMTEINDAVLSGKMTVLPQPRTSKQSGNYILQKKDHWWLNRRAIDRYFYTTRCVGPNWLAVIDLLQKDGVYMGEEVIHNMAGVLVKSAWCERFYTTPDILPAKEIV